MTDITPNTINTESAVRFCLWFQKSYNKLIGCLAIRTALDEDVFHDTFLMIRRRILCRGDIVDYAPYFIGDYHKNHQKRQLSESRFIHPDDDYFFRTLAFIDESNNGNSLDSLALDVMAFVKENFTSEQYELFCLYTVENGFSAKELSCYTGLSPGAIYRLFTTIKKAVLQECNLKSRWNQYLLAQIS